MLDYYDTKIGNETPRDRKLQKQIIEKIKKEKLQKYQFKYLARNIGKGDHTSLKRLHEKDENGIILATYLNRTIIENKIIKYNY